MATGGSYDKLKAQVLAINRAGETTLGITLILASTVFFGTCQSVAGLKWPFKMPLWYVINSQQVNIPTDPAN